MTRAKPEAVLDALEALRSIVTLEGQKAEAIRSLVAVALGVGCTWEEIAEALRLNSKQTAWARYHEVRP